LESIPGLHKRLKIRSLAPRPPTSVYTIIVRQQQKQARFPGSTGHQLVCTISLCASSGIRQGILAHRATNLMCTLSQCTNNSRQGFLAPQATSLVCTLVLCASISNRLGTMLANWASNLVCTLSQCASRSRQGIPAPQATNLVVYTIIVDKQQYQATHPGSRGHQSSVYTIIVRQQLARYPGSHTSILGVYTIIVDKQQY
jgi:hypothetical protein